MLRGCRKARWNVWSLKDYGVRHYAVDDALYLGEFGIASVMTEYGFTPGTADVAANLEAGNAVQGVSDACAAFESE
jgi:hypothetical protein